MRDILRSMALDHRIMKRNYPILAGFYALAVVLSVVAKAPFLAVAITMVLTAPFIGTYFSLYEKNRLDRLYGSLPLGRSSVVVGRYAYAFVMMLANVAASLLLGLFLSLFVQDTATPFLTSVIVAGGFLYACLFFAFLLPLYFKVSFSKVYVFVNLPFYLVVIAGLLLVKKTDILTSLQPTIKYFMDNPAMVWVVGIGIGLVLLGASLPLSIAFHKSRESA